MLISELNLLILAKCSVEAFAISYNPQIIVLDSAFMIYVFLLSHISIQILSCFKSIDGITLYTNQCCYREVSFTGKVH